MEKVAKTNALPYNEEVIKKYTYCIKNSEILKDAIDTTILPSNDYFSNKKYLHFPVVGVSQESAMYYCIWRTQTENDKLDKQRKPRIHQYRLPLEEEWAYVATQPKSLIVNTKSVEDLPGPSKCNKPNIWGLYNLEGNVSEWTASYIKHGNLSDTEKENKQYVVRGGSWRNNNGADARIIADQSEKAANIGFRIVRTCLSGR